MPIQKSEVDIKICKQGRLSRPVFFNLFEVAEPKMTSKSLAEPELPSKNFAEPQLF